jgi:hypothetical protein
LGAKTRYKLENGSYEVLKENPGVRRFVWEHVVEMNRLFHVLAEAGATISAKKLKIAVLEAVVMGQLMTYKGRRPDMTKVAKIESWQE